MELLGYVCLLLMGITLGLVGAGGSILTIPILVFLFNIPIVIATTYSLVIVGSSAFVGSIRYRNSILFKKALCFAIPSILGVYLSRSHLLQSLPPYFGVLSMNDFLLLLLVVFMIFAGYFMIRSPSFQTINGGELSLQTQFKVAVLGFCVGVLIGLLGAGGGFLIVPALVLLMGFQMQEAVPTSLFIIAINSLAGFISDKHHLIDKDWKSLFGYLGVSFLGLFLGIYSGKYIKGSELKRGFGWFVLVMALVIYVREFIL